MRLFFPRRKKQPFRRNSEYLAYFLSFKKLTKKPAKRAAVFTFLHAHIHPREKTEGLGTPF